ncbi:hypothetical protein [Anaeromyxobacter oryzae]|uniref:Lipocalin-like domain-containing protein n=1 Tax=Anaeromyxobacter oryzae TaxID=2918170 RepID=A0ABM7WXC8_9BACT|nr:hypothetical protein [Anaeromyxobacter oryzae]BDG04166.1 hypothetical protein AMOR_31620 [Anaeromyxobacter oryzae]
MKRLFVGLGLTALLACSGGKSGGDPVLDQDYASNFTGTWTGPFTITADGTSSTSTVLQTITSPAANRLELGDFCTDLSSVTAIVTSASTFRLDPRACPPMSVTGCSAVTVTYDRGTGSLSSGTLTLDASGTMSGCGQKFSYTARLVGTRTTVMLAAGATPSWANAVADAVEAGAR